MEKNASAWRSTPGIAKIIMLCQTAIIFFLSFWIYQEYERNVYLQAYVSSLVGGDFVLIVAGSTAFFSSLVGALYLRLHKARQELHEVLSAEAPGLTGSTPGFLDRRMEEHLIDMIRRKNQAENLGTATTAPMLKGMDQKRDTSQ